MPAVCLSVPHNRSNRIKKGTGLVILKTQGEHNPQWPLPGHGCEVVLYKASGIFFRLEQGKVASSMGAFGPGDRRGNLRD